MQQLAYIYSVQCISIFAGRRRRSQLATASIVLHALPAGHPPGIDDHMAATAPDVARSVLRMAAAAIVLLVAVGASTVLHLAAAAVPPPDAAQHGVTVSVSQRQVRAQHV